MPTRSRPQSRAKRRSSEVYVKVEKRAGHGFGNALPKQIDRATDTLAFLWDRLGGPKPELSALVK